MPAAPKTKASELIEKVNALLNREERDEFTLRKIKIEAEKLRPSNAFSAYVLLGMLASLEDDVDEMRANHLAALKLRPNDPVGNLNYSTSLVHLGFYSEAREYALKAYEGNRGSATFLSLLIDRCYKSGRVQQAKGWIHEWETLNPEQDHDLKNSILAANELLKEDGIGDEVVEELVELSLDVLRRNNFHPDGVDIEFLADEDSRWLNYTFIVRQSPDIIVNLIFESAKELAMSNIPSQATDAVIVTNSSALD